MGKQNTRDMTIGVVWKQLLFFAIPLILGDLLQQFYSTTDSIIVGRFVSKQALAAVTGTETVVNIIIGIFTGLSVGTTIVISQLFGARKYNELHEAVQTSIVMTLVGGVVFSIIGVLLTPFLLKVLSTPQDVWKDASQYLSIYFGGMIGLVTYNICTGILRAVGNTKLPLYALIITAGCNIALDLLFVVVFKMGVVGAAIATIGSQIASAAFLLRYLCKSEEFYKVEIRKLSVNKLQLLRILQVGIPVSVQKSLVAVSNIIVISRINLFGSGAMAAWGVYRKIDRLMLNVVQNLGISVSTFIGQNYGAKKSKRLREGSKHGYILCILFSIIFISLTIAFRRPIIRLFNTDNDVLSFGTRIFTYLLPFQIISSINQVQIGTVRGYGDSRGPMFIMLISHVLVRQLYLLIAWGKNPVIETALNCYPIGWFCCLILMLAYERRKYGKAI